MGEDLAQRPSDSLCHLNIRHLGMSMQVPGTLPKHGAEAAWEFNSWRFPNLKITSNLTFVSSRFSTWNSRQTVKHKYRIKVDITILPGLFSQILMILTCEIVAEKINKHLCSPVNAPSSSISIETDYARYWSVVVYLTVLTGITRILAISMIVVTFLLISVVLFSLFQGSWVTKKLDKQ